ncbi:MAG: hypothetical protein ACRDI2_15750 [Chloroflexota bacterium]
MLALLGRLEALQRAGSVRVLPGEAAVRRVDRSSGLSLAGERVVAEHRF